MSGASAAHGDRPAGGPAAVPTTSVPGPRSLTRLLLRPVLRTWLRVRADGAAYVPATGPVLIAATHRSHADSIALALAVGRPVHFLGDLALTRTPVLGPLLPKLGMVPLRRGEVDRAALDVVRGLLSDGHAVVVYPEGSRSRDGAVHRLRSGVARVAAELGVPVVPAGTEGVAQAWPVGHRPRLTGARVTVRFARPYPPPEDTPKDRRTFNQQLQRHLAELSRSPMVDTFAPIGGGDGEAGA
ncbi:MAG: lysophospholipid acyltransferase family protein [Nitriliruptoraceae bacterium]